MNNSAQLCASPAGCQNKAANAAEWLALSKFANTVLAA